MTEIEEIAGTIFDQHYAEKKTDFLEKVASIKGLENKIFSVRQNLREITLKHTQLLKEYAREYETLLRDHNMTKKDLNKAGVKEIKETENKVKKISEKPIP